VALSIAHLVDSDAVELVQPDVVDGVAHHVDDDLGHRLPGDPKEPRDGGLVRVLGQPSHDVLEVAAVARAPASPGDLLGADLGAAPAVDPADLGFEQALRGPEVEMAPAAHAAVVDGPGLPPTGADVLGPPSTQCDHDALGPEDHAGDRGARDGQHPIECGGDAHVCFSSFGGLVASKRRSGCVRVAFSRTGPGLGPGLISWWLAKHRHDGPQGCTPSASGCP